ncbi:helix-turn-helix domain-containing protein [Oryzicola mucosus]
MSALPALPEPPQSQETGSSPQLRASLIARRQQYGDTVAREREAEIIALCDGVIDVTAAMFSVSSKELRRTGRTSLDVSRVRQIAMYVAHVVLGLKMNDIGKGFGRDRTTVIYACHIIEDLRDDIEFDRVVATVERVMKAAFCQNRQI